LTPAVERFFKTQARDETGEGRRWLSNPASALKNPRGRAWLIGEPERNALLRNTISPTVLKGSNKTNTIPPEASVELDIRLLPDQDTLAFRQQLERVIADPKAKLSLFEAVPPRFDAPLDTELFHAIESVVHQMLPGVPVATPVSEGASDRPYYAGAGIICYGLDPFLVPIEDNRKGVHGNDERLSIENVGFGVRFYTNLLESIQ
jgi:carboxypeptidase PM20D1